MIGWKGQPFQTRSLFLRNKIRLSSGMPPAPGKYRTVVMGPVMSTYSTATLRDAYLQWMSDLNVESAIAATLTFKSKANGRAISEKAASDAIRVFSRMIQYAACGSRFKRGLDWINFVAVKEGGHRFGDKRPHYHAFIEVPEGWCMDAWIEVVRKKIKKIEDFGSDNCVIKPVVDGGWTEYMFKRSDKQCYADALDIISLWTKSRST